MSKICVSGRAARSARSSHAYKRPSHLSPDNILRFLQVRRDPASAEDIARGLRVSRNDRRPLFKMLASLQKRGAIAELPGGRYRLQGSKTGAGQAGQRAGKLAGPGSDDGVRRDEITGRLVLHHDGYGFVVPDTPMPQFAGDIFIPRDSVEDAMHGDRVVAKILQDVARGRGRSGPRVGLCGWPGVRIRPWSVNFVFRTAREIVWFLMTRGCSFTRSRFHPGTN